jgi:hypothetical protein
MRKGIRDEVRQYAEQMELKLRKYDRTRGQSWKTADVESLLRFLEEHVQKLRHDVEHPVPGQLGLSAADVGNIAMMVSDVCGTLGDRGETPPPTDPRQGSLFDP